MNKKIGMAMAVMTVLSTMVPAMAEPIGHGDFHPGQQVLSRCGLVLSATAQAPLWLLTDTYTEAQKAVAENDNVLMVVPGAAYGLALGVADAVSSPVDAAITGNDSTFITKQIDEPLANH